MALLELRGVTARYVQRTILRGVDLTVEAGELVALCGPNGAGKSTVLKSIVGLTEVTGGTIQLAGEPAGATPRANLARGIVYLPQGGQVFAPLTVAENLGLAASLAGADGRHDEALAPFDELRGRLRQRAGTLSGGQRQQLALAMALLSQPRLLLVDEPTIGLSAPLARRAMELLSAVRDRLGAGILMVEQNVGLALATCDRAVLLVAGRSVADWPCAAVRSDAGLTEQFMLGLETPVSEPCR